MDIDPMDTANSATEESDGKSNESKAAANSRLATHVAITVALLATFLGICKVKDDNLVQAMQQAQADKLDNWNFYQARNIREQVAIAALDELRLEAQDVPPKREAGYREAISKYEAIVKDQSDKKEAIRQIAEDDQKTYDSLNYRDDQFDLSDALLALAISMLAMTVLTHKRWLFGIAMVPTVLGVLMGLSGLLGWHIHSGTISRLLS